MRGHFPASYRISRYLFLILVSQQTLDTRVPTTRAIAPSFPPAFVPHVPGIMKLLAFSPGPLRRFGNAYNLPI